MSVTAENAAEVSDLERMRALYADVYRDMRERARVAAQQSRTAVEDYETTGEDILDAIFPYVTSSDLKPVRWRHQGGRFLVSTHFEMREKGWEFRFARRELQSGVAAYLDNDWMHIPFLDWLCADVLTFAEYIASLEYFDNARRGLLGSLAAMSRRRGVKALYGAWRVVITVAAWAGWFALLLYFADAVGFWAAAGQVIVTGVWIGRRVWFWRKGGRIMEAMLDAYRRLDSIPVSWKVFGRQLEDARRLGAKWDSEVWRLVELRGG